MLSVEPVTVSVPLIYVVPLTIVPLPLKAIFESWATADVPELLIVPFMKLKLVTAVP